MSLELNRRLATVSLAVAATAAAVIPLAASGTRPTRSTSAEAPRHRRGY